MSCPLPRGLQDSGSQVGAQEKTQASMWQVRALILTSS